MKRIGEGSNIKEQYQRARYILQVVTDGDNQSMEALILRKTWNPQALVYLQDFIKQCEDAGIVYLTN